MPKFPQVNSRYKDPSYLDQPSVSYRGPDSARGGGLPQPSTVPSPPGGVGFPGVETGSPPDYSWMRDPRFTTPWANSAAPQTNPILSYLQDMLRFNQIGAMGGSPGINPMFQRNALMGRNAGMPQLPNSLGGQTPQLGPQAAQASQASAPPKPLPQMASGWQGPQQAQAPSSAFSPLGGQSQQFGGGGGLNQMQNLPFNMGMVPPWLQGAGGAQASPFGFGNMGAQLLLGGPSLSQVGPMPQRPGGYQAQNMLGGGMGGGMGQGGGNLLQMLMSKFSSPFGGLGMMGGGPPTSQAPQQFQPVGAPAGGGLNQMQNLPFNIGMVPPGSPASGGPNQMQNLPWRMTM